VAAGWAALWALVALTLLRLMVAGTTALAPDEAYYWVWSRALAPGYLDHPPMIALWIRAGTALAGPGALGVRLLSPFAAALGSLLLAQAAEDLLPGRRAGLVAAGLLNATLLFGVGAVTATPDTPLLLFWTATLWALSRLHATGNGAWWLAAGAAGGLALDSKYTAILLAPAVLLWVLTVPRLRPWLWRPMPWLAGLVALALFSPVLAWNAAHGWASFVKQGGRTGDWDPSRAVQFVGELFGGQIALATPGIAVLLGAAMVVAARRAWRRDAAWTLIAAMTLLPAAVFLQHALGDRVQANWPAVLYPAAAIGVAGLAPGWTWLRRPAAVLAAAVTALVYIQGIFFVVPLPPRLDPAFSRLAGWSGFARAVAELAQADRARFVAVESFGDAAELARLLPPDLPVLAVDWRWAQFELPDGAPAATGVGLLLRPARRTDPPAATGWTNSERLPDLARAQSGVVAAQYRLYRVLGHAGRVPIVVLPRPN
jgi:4-amino-4-deoxy-L-arabinose transferase-like glycosyltransferase